MNISIRLLILLFVLAILQADEPRHFTADLPGAELQKLPKWIRSLSTEPSHPFPSLNCELLPIDDSSELLVTLYFREPSDGFLRASWQVGDQSLLLARNLYEGVGTYHQKSLLLTRAMLEQAGSLSLEPSSRKMPIYRIHFEWVQPTFVLGAPGTPDVITDVAGSFQTRELIGTLPSPPDDKWEDWVIRAPLARSTQLMESGMRLEFPLDEVPDQVAFELTITGAPVEQSFQLKINGHNAGFLPLPVPPLSDPGYRLASSGVWEFAGWRTGRIHLPAEFLKPGVNTIQVSFKSGESTARISMRPPMLELKYDPRITLPPPPVSPPLSLDPALPKLAEPESTDYPLEILEPED